MRFIKAWVVLVALPVVVATGPAAAQGILQVPAQQISAETLPMRLECQDDEYPLVVLVHNTYFVPKFIGVEAVFVDRNARIVATVAPYFLNAQVKNGERALLGRCVGLPRGVAVSTIRLHAIPDSWRVDLPLRILLWLSVGTPTVETWEEMGGYHLCARATLLAENRRRVDVVVVGRLRFYNAQGYQVGSCGSPTES